MLIVPVLQNLALFFTSETKISIIFATVMTSKAKPCKSTGFPALF